MDPLSHYMFAWLIGRRLRLEAGYLKVFLILALIPDFDVASVVFGYQAAREFHGTLTHTFFIAFLLATVATAGFARIFRTGFLQTFKYGVLGVATHFLLDFFNLSTYSNKGQGRFLWPIYQDTLYLGMLLGIPLEYSTAIYFAIFISMVFAVSYYWRKGEPPWNVWFPK